MTLNLEVDIKDFKKVFSGKGSTSKGYQSKFTNGIQWIKLDKEGDNESLAEEFTSELLKLSDLVPDDYVEYKRCEVYDGKIYLGTGCVSNSFITPEESIITFQRLFEVSGFNSADMYESINEYDNLIYEVKRIIKKTAGLDVMEYLKKVITIDSIILNPDRHFNNLALIFNNITEEYRFAPIFDNGQGFLMGDRLSEDKPIDYYVKRTFSKPFYHNFESQYRLLGCPGIVFDKNKVLSLLDDYNNEKISHVMKLAFNKYSEAFKYRNNIKSF